MKRNCKCIEKLKRQLTEQMEGENVEPEEVNLFNYVTFTHFSYNKVGQKKKKKSFVIHSFCPWCGTSYE